MVVGVDERRGRGVAGWVKFAQCEAGALTTRQPRVTPSKKLDPANTHFALASTPQRQPWRPTTATPRMAATTIPRPMCSWATRPRTPQATPSPTLGALRYAHTQHASKSVTKPSFRVGSTIRQPPRAHWQSARSAMASSVFCSSSTATCPTRFPATSDDCTFGRVGARRAGGRRAA